MNNWNLDRYLVRRDGSQAPSFGSSIAPDDAKPTLQVERVLKSALRS